MAERVLVTGGTGKTGRLVATGLEARGVTARIATRRPTGDREVLFAWNDPSTFSPAMDGADAVYLVAPTDRTDHLDVMRPLLESAVSQDIRVVLLGSSALDDGAPMMGEVQQWLRGHASRWASLRPSWFMQNFTTQHLPAITSDDAIYSATDDGRIAFIDAADIAAVAVEALIAANPITGDVVLTGPAAITYDEVARTISHVAGRIIRHKRLSVDHLARRYTAMGLPESYAQTLAAMDGTIARGSEDRVTDAVQRAVGRTPRSFSEFALANQAIFERR